MSRPVLHRVIHGHSTPEPWQAALIRTRPALLRDHVRRRVRHADYPGLTPSKGFVQSEDSVAAVHDRPSVLGTLVEGLTDGDLFRLDAFEGDEYARCPVKVQILNLDHATGDSSDGTGKTLNSTGDAVQALDLESLPPATDSVWDADADADAVATQTYIWIAGEDGLEPGEWDFAEFVRERLHRWVGPEVQREDYDAVDQAVQDNNSSVPVSTDMPVVQARMQGLVERDK